MGTTRSTSPRATTMAVRDLKQIRALSDPRKLRLLKAFERPRTTLQVAARLGVSPTALYRHVNALWKLKLLRVVSERPKRGTVERTFQAAASRFAASADAFARTSAPQAAIQKLFREAEARLLAVDPEAELDPDRAPLVVGVRMVGTTAEIARFRREVLALAKRLGRPRPGRAGRGEIAASALLVFTPEPD